MRAALLGIDSGTQSTKAILVEADTGRVLSLGRAPQWWVEALTRSVQEALASPGVEVLGIGVSGISFESVWPSSFDIPLSPYPVPGYRVSIHPGLIFFE
jgi:sugar (pentulose or hexulose) kinase